MKKLFLIIISFICLYNLFAEANENGTIEHIGNDIILNYSGENIILYNDTIDGTTQKCPIGYHIGTKDDWSKIINIWYNIKGNNYKYMKLSEKDGYSIEELYEQKDWDSCMRENNYVAGSCNESYPGDDAFGLYKEFKDDLKIGLGGGGLYRYTTSSYGHNHTPYIFEYEMKFSSRGVNGLVQLKTCSNNKNLDDYCGKIKLVRCFKDTGDTIINNGFSKEYNDAYIFAYNNKITTMSTIEQANMNGEIIRAEIAKMLANWVKKFGYYADPSIPCNFTDTSSVKGDLATAIIESCQYGIMGQGINQFRPYDKITKAEVATAVSRILRGPKYDGGTPFYINHVRELKNNGIILDDSSINSNELRGNVMATLMRANNILEYNSICENIEYILACADNEENCPEKCRKN